MSEEVDDEWDEEEFDPAESSVCIFCVAGLVHVRTDRCGGDSEGTIPDESPKPGVVGRPPKVGEEMEDVLSTGRKRAAVAAPIEVGMVCEWAFLKAAGGGVVPIQGCLGNPASDRHHGPDKSVLNNEVGTNLHRICDFCHNRWHSLNDEYYGERPPNGTPFLPINHDCIPHNPDARMTKAEALLAEMQRTK